MIFNEQLNIELNQLKPDVDALYAILNIEEQTKSLNELEEQTTMVNFWDDNNNSQAIFKKISSIKNELESYTKLTTDFEDLETMLQIALEEDDASMSNEIAELLKQLKSDYDSIKLRALLNGEYDNCNAIVSLNAGAGGREAQDWVQMLYRMYSKYAERLGFKIQVLNTL